MQWGSRGFSEVEPWLPYGRIRRASVEAQRDDPASLLSLHRRLLRVRREFALEPYETVSAEDRWCSGGGLRRRGERQRRRGRGALRGRSSWRRT
jgi:hypothetical protein